jgi:hypothetical protein
LPELFNKEAYLDLSKPYKQKNPQSATKKDNQATTILKEVAGTARTALGFLSSVHQYLPHYDLHQMRLKMYWLCYSQNRHRLLVEDDMAIAGINVFTDYESKSSPKTLPLMSGPALASQ